MLKQVPKWLKWAGAIAGALVAIIGLMGLMWTSVDTAIDRAVTKYVANDATVQSIHKRIDDENTRVDGLIRDNGDKIKTLNDGLKNQTKLATSLDTDLHALDTRTNSLKPIADEVVGKKEHLIAVIRELKDSATAEAVIDKTIKLMEQNAILMNELRHAITELTGRVTSLDSSLRDIPSLVDRKLSDNIVTSLPDSSSTADGYLRARDMLVCWGRKPLELSAKSGDPNTNSRLFEFAFPREFAGPPTVANAILTKSAVDSFAVYNYEITSTKYFGGVINRKPTDAEVTFEYIAIGRAKQ
jgi:hypothetical protein